MTDAWVEAPKALVLVDFSAIAYACWATAERAHEADAKYDPHEVLKGNLKMKLATIVEDTPVATPRELVMVLDSHPKWKYDTFPGYKANREERFNPRPEAEAFLREAYPGMKWVQAPGQEADDAIATLVQDFRAKQVVVIASGDKDLWQLFDPPAVRIYNPITQKYLEPEKVGEKFHGLERQHIRAAKAFWGDTSDGLPNVAPRMQKQLTHLIKEADGDLLKTLELAKTRANETCLGHLTKNVEQIVVNWTMAGLNDNVELVWS